MPSRLVYVALLGAYLNELEFSVKGGPLRLSACLGWVLSVAPLFPWQAMAASPTPSPAAPLPAATQPPGLAPAMQQQKQQLAAPETTAAEACATAAQRAQQAAAETPLSPFAQQLQLTLAALF